MNTYGTLTDYITGEAIRPATVVELAQSLNAGETGAFDLDGQTVFVAGGDEQAAEVGQNDPTPATEGQVRAIVNLHDDIAGGFVELDAIAREAALMTRAEADEEMKTLSAIRDQIRKEHAEEDAAATPHQVLLLGGYDQS